MKFFDRKNVFYDEEMSMLSILLQMSAFTWQKQIKYPNHEYNKPDNGE